MRERWRGRLAAWRLARRRARLAKGRRPLPRSTILLLSTLALLVLSVVWSFAVLAPSGRGQEASLDQLQALADQRRVVRAVFKDEDARVQLYVSSRPRPEPRPDAAGPTISTSTTLAVDGTAGGSDDISLLTDLGLISPEVTATTVAPDAPAPTGRTTPRWTTYPKNDADTGQLIAALTGSGARVQVDPQSGKAAVRLLLTVMLPLMILANLFALFFASARGGSSALGEVVAFGTIRRDKGGRSQGQVTTFADVAGLEEAIVEVHEVVDYLRSPDRYRDMNAIPPKGVLLTGPPGCGKTLLARAVAGEAEVPFFSVAGAEFVEALVGVGAARVRDLFARVRAVAPAIVFIDELDAAGRRRSASGGGGSEERDQTLNQLLVEMDGFDVATGIVVIAATNRSDILDPALMRPGRFDRHITIERPDVERREAILRLHASRRRMTSDIDFAMLARQTPGFSGADLASVVNEAALLTLRGGGSTIGAQAFSDAVQRVMNGPRQTHLLGDEERRRIAVHESGHAVLAALSGREVQRVSIVARGSGLGSVGFEAEEESVTSRSRLLSRLAVQLGGRAAEEVVLGEGSTGAEDDIEQVTAIARLMVGSWGLTDDIGMTRVFLPERDSALDGSAQLGPLAPETHAAFDRAVRTLVDDAFATAKVLITKHRTTVDTLVGRLLEEETLEGKPLAALLPSAVSTATPLTAVPTGNGATGARSRTRR